MDGNDHTCPSNQIQWCEDDVLVHDLCMVLLTVSGIFIWRAQFSVPVDLARFGAVIHAAVTAIMIAMIYSCMCMPPSGPEAPSAPCGTGR